MTDVHGKGIAAALEALGIFAATDGDWSLDLAIRPHSGARLTLSRLLTPAELGALTAAIAGATAPPKPEQGDR